MNKTNHITIHKFAGSVASAVRGLLPSRLLDQASVPFDSLLLHPGSETRHVKLIGNTGTGKSAAIEHCLAKIAERPSQRVVVVDPDGRYARLFYRPERGDRIVNPFDARDCGWDLNADITQPYHAGELARALVPTKSGESEEWTQYGQELVRATIAALKQMAELTVETLYQTLTKTPPEEYAKLVAATPAAAFFQPGNERMRGRIESVVAPAIAGLQYMRAGSLSLSQYAQSDDKGWIFFTYKAEQNVALQSVIATMMRVVAFSLMSRPEGDSETWLVVDELDTLGKIADLTDALQRLRKFGGRCVLAFQSARLLAEIYGPNYTAALLESCASTLLLRSSTSEAEFVAPLVGNREVLPSQIEQLENLQGYARMYGSPSWRRCTIEPYAGEQIAEAFVPRTPDSAQEAA